MLNFLLRRSISSLVVILTVTVITFFILNWLPGDPALLILGLEANPEQLESLRETLGFYEPWYQQYFSWLFNLIKGDWGQSMIFGEEVLTLVIQRLPVSLSLTIFSVLIALIISFTLGILSAIKKNSWIDLFSRSIMQLGMAIPSFWIALLLMIVFGAWLKVLPTSDFVSPSEGFLPFLKSIILPSLALALAEVGVLIRIVRSSMLTALNEDYMEMAAIRGLPNHIKYVKYALRDALVAPITVLGVQLAKLIAGTVVIESVFSLPGIGRLLLVAVEQRDIILLQGLIIFITIAIVLINLLMDILYSYIDPRIKLDKGAGI